VYKQLGSGARRPIALITKRVDVEIYAAKRITRPECRNKLKKNRRKSMEAVGGREPVEMRQDARREIYRYMEPATAQHVPRP
jgi:hypothetical protein